MTDGQHALSLIDQAANACRTAADSNCISGASARMTERKILQPFDKRECCSLKQAANIAGKSESTLRGWCEAHGLGRRVGGGTWAVSKVALAMFLDGDTIALKAYHEGDRTSELVSAYFAIVSK